VFDELEADGDLFELRHRGEPVDIQRKALDVLLYLVRHRDRVVTRSELVENVWGGITITENAIAQAVSALRTTLAMIGCQAITTIRGRGFRFALPVRQMSREQKPPTPARRTQSPAPNLVLLLEPTSRLEVDAALGPFEGASRVIVHAGHGQRRSFGTLLDVARASNSQFRPDASDGIEDALAAIRASTHEPLVIVILHAEQADVASLLFLTRGSLLIAGGVAAIIMTCEVSALTRDDDVGALLRSIGGGAREQDPQESRQSSMRWAAPERREA
jgi:DNA-binding winged helix-turn-helix (wHTH) protein